MTYTQESRIWNRKLACPCKFLVQETCRTNMADNKFNRWWQQKTQPTNQTAHFWSHPCRFFCVKSCFNLVQETCTVKNCARMRVTFKKLLQVSGTSSATRFLIMCHPYNSDDDADKSVTLERLWSINQSITQLVTCHNVNLKKQIAGTDTVYD